MVFRWPNSSENNVLVPKDSLDHTTQWPIQYFSFGNTCLYYNLYCVYVLVVSCRISAKLRFSAVATLVLFLLKFMEKLMKTFSNYMLWLEFLQKWNKPIINTYVWNENMKGFSITYNTILGQSLAPFILPYQKAFNKALNRALNKALIVIKVPC